MDLTSFAEDLKRLVFSPLHQPSLSSSHLVLPERQTIPHPSPAFQRVAAGWPQLRDMPKGLRAARTSSERRCRQTYTLSCPKGAKGSQNPGQSGAWDCRRKEERERDRSRYNPGALSPRRLDSKAQGWISATRSLLGFLACGCIYPLDQ